MRTLKFIRAARKNLLISKQSPFTTRVMGRHPPNRSPKLDRGILPTLACAAAHAIGGACDFVGPSRQPARR
jgi:hypothetical protein